MSIKKYFILFIITFSLLTSNSFATSECFEKASRVSFKFNMAFDRAILKPIAKGYNKLPESIRNGAGNFTSNIATLLSIPNYALQGNVKGTVDASASFLINTSIGILGFGNPAAALGFEAQQEDVGQTLGSYGVKSGCYFVLPILGPTTARDSIGMIADTFVDPFSIVTLKEKELLGISGSKLDYFSVKGATAVDFRGDNMENFDNLEKNSIDIYSSLKSVYLQDRENKIKNSKSSDGDDSWESLEK